MNDISFLGRFANMLGIKRYQAEDALTNERAAKLVLSRRSFVGVSAALATGAAFGFYKKLDYLPWNNPAYLYARLEGDDPSVNYGNLAIKRCPDSFEVESAAVKLKSILTFPEAKGGNAVMRYLAWYDAGGRLVVPRTELYPSVRIVAGVTPQVMGGLRLVYGDV